MTFRGKKARKYVCTSSKYEVNHSEKKKFTTGILRCHQNEKCCEQKKNE